MRYYALRIGEALYRHDIGVQGVSIQFSIQNFKAGESVNSQLTIHNVPVEQLGQFANLYNKRIYLQGGMRRSPINGYNPPLKDTLASGYISSVIGQPNGINRELTLIFQKTSTQKLTPPFILSIKQGASPDAQIQMCYQALTGGAIPLTIGGTLPTQRNVNEKIETIEDLTRVMNTMGLDLIETASGYRQIIKDKPTPIGVKMITSGELLGQPFAVGVGEVSITTYLRGDFSVGDIVTFSPEVFFSSQNLDNLRDVRGLVNSGKSLYGGSYVVSAVQHDGDSNNPDALQWATTLRCVRKGA